ncbi:hypothetical protein DFH07DRAFT_141110 [Mycena maculata]|uniref:Uncharacterized protein n=1 Tax=Mycena maculata TaxID=230809 RepID=A0AAD7JZH8_9AGAR|nr:hypothetical protein DFH07DRAFT_309979 [Mycena maculata]KAJ7773748.1 hypothetical protein DFH07DRAFT_141110 [Mycena maculata]
MNSQPFAAAAPDSRPRGTRWIFSTASESNGIEGSSISHSVDTVFRPSKISSHFHAYGFPVNFQAWKTHGSSDRVTLVNFKTSFPGNLSSLQGYRKISQSRGRLPLWDWTSNGSVYGGKPVDRLLPSSHKGFLALSACSSFHAHLQPLQLIYAVITEAEFIECLSFFAQLEIADHEPGRDDGHEFHLIIDTLLSSLTLTRTANSTLSFPHVPLLP